MHELPALGQARDAVQARDAAWVRTQVRWALRAQDWLLDRAEEASARATGMTSRHLLTPLLTVRPVLE